MATISAAFRPGYVLRLEFWFGGVSGRSIPVFYEVWIDKAPGYSGYWNQFGNIRVWGIDGQPRQFDIAGADFRGGGTGGRSFLMASGSGWAGYGADGNLRYATGVIASLTDVGTANPPDGFIDAPYIGPAATRPSQPGAPTFSEITTTSVRVSWAPSANNGGAGIGGYLLRRRSVVDGSYVDVSFENNTSRVVAGLTPGTQYVFSVYANNSVGYSDQSAQVAVRTLSGARVGKANAFVAAEARVGKSSAFPLAEVRVAKGGSYVSAG